MLDQCCGGDIAYLLLQINVICLLLALIGSAAIINHPAWFGGAPASAAQTIAER
jgi:phosphate/sulfate permease